MGNRGLKLPIAMPINVPIRPRQCAGGPACHPSLNTSLAQARRPWQGIRLATRIHSQFQFWYNAMNVRVEGRFGSRLTFLRGLYVFEGIGSILIHEHGNPNHRRQSQTE